MFNVSLVTDDHFHSHGERIMDLTQLLDTDLNQFLVFVTQLQIAVKGLPGWAYVLMGMAIMLVFKSRRAAKAAPVVDNSTALGMHILGLVNHPERWLVERPSSYQLTAHSPKDGLTLGFETTAQGEITSRFPSIVLDHSQSLNGHVSEKMMAKIDRSARRIVTPYFSTLEKQQKAESHRMAGDYLADLVNRTHRSI